MRRILFVDDEPAVLDGLRRVLYSRSADWHMAFATSGPEALGLLETGDFDVIVSDLRMPGMDGAELLRQVRTRYPGVIRIALSGCAERETAVRAAGLVHQYLAKPCDAAVLGDSIDRFCASTAMVADETVRRVVGAIGALPSLPQTVSALVEALRNPEATLAEIGAIIAKDVGMTARVLQLVNSPLFALLCEITSLQSAIALIGPDTLRQLLLSAEVLRSFDPERPIQGFSLAEFEAHSALTAKIAARLPVPKSIHPSALTAALLHDIGKLVLAVRLPEQFESCLRLSHEQQRPLFQVEAESIGATHAEIGAYLLSLWGLAPAIVDAVSRHHRPVPCEFEPGLDIAGIVHVSDALACSLAGGTSGPERSVRDLLDWEYLTAQAVSDQVPAWRALAQKIWETDFPARQTS
jgi:putative nucleotidyltransferase with HDIG domain